MALDPTTGKILWQTADPQTETLPAPTGTVGVWDLRRSRVANGVVYAASMAEDRATRCTRSTRRRARSSGSTRRAARSTPAPAVVDGSVYWGSGYSQAAEGSGNNKLYAFSIGGCRRHDPADDGDRAGAGCAERLERLVHEPGRSRR